MTYKVLSCGTPLQGNAEAGKVIVEGKVQLPSINPGETGTARFELPDSFRKGDVLELEAFDREGKSICNWTYPIHLAKQYFERNLAQTTLTPAPQKAVSLSSLAPHLEYRSHFPYPELPGIHLPLLLP